ncbi:MAG: RNA polymerase sigma factor [Betaproteobacteria bacterium]|nr:RNA polymerase sigma factor [Betaproteobacteria bacterium]
MATENELSAFLAEVERRAYHRARFAVRDHHLALDMVQEAMLKLVQSYRDKPAEELPLLFQHILMNNIRDHFRRQKVRDTWTSLLSALRPGGADGSDDSDPLETLEVKDGPQRPQTPEESLTQERVMQVIEEGISKLSDRQREAFLLRYWEDFDVTETAEVMGCSEGSVKTHCSRAVRALADYLRSRGVTL